MKNPMNAIARMLYYKNGKLKKNITLKQLLSMKTDVGRLISVSYSCGGGMNGERNSIELTDDGEGPIIRTLKSGSAWLPARVHEYKAPENAFQIAGDYIVKYNLPRWSDLPLNEDFIALDAPSRTISFAFDNESIGGSMRDYYSVSFDDAIPDGGFSILNGFVKLLSSFVDPSSLIQTYLESDNKQIFTGKNIQNTDPEIGELLKGYWESRSVRFTDRKNNTIHEKQSNRDDCFMVYEQYDEKEYVIKKYKKNTNTEEISFTKECFIHSPLKDRDSSWFMPLKCDEENLKKLLASIGVDSDYASKEFALTVDGDSMYLQSMETDPMVEIVFTRVD